MTNEEILKEQFIQHRTYTKEGRSVEHIETLIRCNSLAHNDAIGEIDEITITPMDDIVIVRSPIVTVTYEIREYKRKQDFADGEVINSEIP